MLPRVLIIGEDLEHRRTLAEAVSRCMLLPVECATFSAAEELFLRQRFVAVLCAALSNDEFREVISLAARSKTHAPVIIVSHLDDWDSYLGFMGAGAFDHIDFPLYPGELERVLYAALCRSRPFQRIA